MKIKKEVDIIYSIKLILVYNNLPLRKR